MKKGGLNAVIPAAYLFRCPPYVARVSKPESKECYYYEIYFPNNLLFPYI